MEWKTYFTDGLVQIAILLSLFRSDWNNYFDSSLYSGNQEIQEIYNGPLSAYTRTYTHANEWHSGSIGLSHPKSMTFDYSSSIFQDIHSLARYRHFDTEISAFLVGDNQPPSHSETAHISQGQVAPDAASGDANGSHEQSGLDNETNNSSFPSAVEGADSSQDRSEILSYVFPEAELTKEDMDLIDILWRQDIDLGVARDAYDATRRLELDKENENELQQHREKEKQLSEAQGDNSTNNQNGNVTYVQDNETGEMVAVTVSETDTPIVIDEVPFTQPQLPHEVSAEQSHQPNETNSQTISLNDDGMQILENEVDNFTLSERSSETTNNTINEQLQELESLIRGTDLYDNTTERPTLHRESSVEQRWQDISNLLPIEDVDNNTVLSEFSSLLEDYNNTNATDLAHNSLLQNASLVVPTNPANNLSFSEAFNYTGPPPSDDTMMTESLHLMDALALGLQNSTLNTATYINSTDSLLQQLLRDQITDVDFIDLDANNEAHAMETNVSSDSAISSAGSSSMTTGSDIASPSHLQDLSDVQSNISSPYDTLEGATGGSDGDSTGYETKHKYDPDYTYGHTSYNNNNDELRLNHTDSSNASLTDYETTDHARQVNHNHTYPLQPGQLPKERKSKLLKEEMIHDIQYTRDEKRAKAMKIPLSMDDMIGSTVEAFNEMLENHRLTDRQLQLIRDIRRRGKNKVAAQNCRKRKLEVIQVLEEEVERMRDERDRLRNQRRALNKESTVVKHKYSQLYEDTFRSLRDDDGRPYDPSEYALQQNEEGELLLVPHDATFINDEPKTKGSRKRKHDRKGH